MVNILYVVKEGLLNSPVLYLSRFINQSDCYRLLQQVRETREWEPYLLYRLGGIETTSRKTPSKYLEDLVGTRLLEKHKVGKENFYLNTSLFRLLQET